KAFAEGKRVSGISLEKAAEKPRNVSPFEAIELAIEAGIPLHPNYLAYYTALSIGELKKLVAACQKAEKLFGGERIVGARLENKAETKDFLERIGLPHKLEKVSEKSGESETQRTVILIAEEFAYAFLKTMGALRPGSAEELVKENVLESLTEISGMQIRDKAGTFVGARMGRPEQAKPRLMKGNPHALFPIGLFGGSTRSMNKAMLNSINRNMAEGTIEAEIALFKCGKCGQLRETQKCIECNSRTVRVSKCIRCGRINPGESAKCESCNGLTVGYEKRAYNLAKIVENGTRKLNARIPEPLKGVKGLISKDKVPEPIEKGILRAKYNLHVFRDGTMRYELLNAPLTHFMPKEIGITAEKAMELGYLEDMNGKPLESDDQMLEMFPQDLVVHEGCGDWLLKVSQFTDELLSKYYGVQSYFNAKTKEDIIGELVMGLAPHTSAGIVARIIGYSKARLGWGTPYFHTVKRRNVDGDQDSIMLLMDALLNFSEDYLSDKRGGRMDAPLVFTIALDPTEVDSEVYEMETCSSFPLEFYEKTLELTMPKAVKGISIVNDKLGTKGQYDGIGFTHETGCFDEGPKQSMYITLATMEDKIKTQARLQGKIRAVQTKDALERVLASHFLPDIIGNAHSFSRQSFRCTNCNAKYRRIPLCGKCTKCKEGHLILTIAQGSVRKYLAIAKEIIATYQLSSYLKQRVDLIEREINSVFISDRPEEEKTAQKSLFEYV
ncbi:MAG: DNA polymerase II large subunit, partial [archaeon]